MPTVLSYVLCLTSVSGFESHSLRQSFCFLRFNPHQYHHQYHSAGFHTQNTPPLRRLSA